MSSVCSGIFVAYKDGGDYVRIRYRCSTDGMFLELKPGAKFCPNCGRSIPEYVEMLSPPSRFVAQVEISGEWETVE